MLRSRRLLGVVALLCLLGSGAQVGIADPARASGDGDRVEFSTARPYQQGPLEPRDRGLMPDLPRGAEELLGLSVLAAILYGLRASGLARNDLRNRRRRLFSAHRRLR